MRRPTSILVLSLFLVVGAGAARADGLVGKAGHALASRLEKRRSIGQPAMMHYRGHVLTTIDLGDHPVLSGAVARLREGLDQYASALERRHRGHVDARHMRVVEAEAVYRGWRLHGYELTIITHNSMFPVRSTVKVSRDGTLPPLFASSTDASDGVFGGRWMGWSNEVLEDLHASAR